MISSKIAVPDNSKRRILLAVAARSPQIVTETLYALTQQEQGGMPTEVRIITTRRGEPYVRQLLDEGEKSGWINRLCDDYQLPKPACDESHIHLITDNDGNVLDDVRSCEDNTNAADFITRIVQDLTADADSSLVVSLSGGRRTMTFYAGYALSLFGRSQDRLTHVLVEEEYFFNAEFFYPPPRATWVMREDDSGFDASKVEVTLADIPFVRLREGLPSRLLSGQTSFSDTVDAAQAELGPPRVTLNLQGGELRCGGQRVAMSWVELSFYAMMLKRCVAGEAPVRWNDPDMAEIFLKEYRLSHGGSGLYERACRTLSNGMTKEYFEQRKSRINRHLREVLGKRLSQFYMIDSHGKRPNTRFGLTLSPECIFLD